MSTDQVTSADTGSRSQRRRVLSTLRGQARWIRVFAVGLTLGALLFASVASVAASREKRLTVVGHATSYVTTQSDPTGNVFEPGDEVFLGAFLTKNATSQEQIGLAALHCAVTGAAGSAFLCDAAFTLPDGKIMAQVLFDQTEWISPTNRLAITGGTGRYRHAHGEVIVGTLSSGDETFTFDFD